MLAFFIGLALRQAGLRPGGALLREAGDPLLLENGGRLLLE